MTMYNHITGTLAGSVGRVGELRYTPGGAAVIDLSVAVNTKRGDVEETTWFEVTAWNELAERVAEDPAALPGSNAVVHFERVGVDAYEGRDGIAAKVKVTAESVRLFPKRERDDEDDRPRSNRRQEAAQDAQPQRRPVSNGAASQRRTAAPSRGPAL